MNTFHIRKLQRLAAAVGLSLAVLTPAQAQPGTPAAPALSQQEIWQRAKFPWRYPTAPAQDNAERSPALSQQELWKRAKFPWLYPTSATSTGPICPGWQFQPGSAEALKAAKTPWLVPHRSCVKSDG